MNTFMATENTFKRKKKIIYAKGKKKEKVPPPLPENERYFLTPKIHRIIKHFEAARLAVNLGTLWVGSYSGQNMNK